MHTKKKKKKNKKNKYIYIPSKNIYIYIFFKTKKKINHQEGKLAISYPLKTSFKNNLLALFSKGTKISLSPNLSHYPLYPITDLKIIYIFLI